MNYSQEQINELKRKAIQIRANILEMIPPGKVGHLGGSSSIADVMAALYFHIIKVNLSDPKDPRCDHLIMSKGHAVLIQYACLVELGYFGREELTKPKTFNGMLQGHPDIDKTLGIEAVTGSLGQGLSVSLGIAGMAEALVLATRAEVDPEKMFKAICGGLAGSTVLDAKVPLVFPGNFKPGFRIDLHIKDLQNTLDPAASIDAPTPISSSVIEMMSALSAEEKGSDDHGGLIQWYETQAKIEVRS